jgi:bacillithiol system protein YtxJ
MDGRMSNLLKPLSTVEELDAAIAASASRPVLIFKHSATCGTSAMASEELDDLIAGAPLHADIYLVRIQATRALSNEIERRLGVRHESPQILLIRDGKVVWSATHYRVTAANIAAAVEQFATQAR